MELELLLQCLHVFPVYSPALLGVGGGGRGEGVQKKFHSGFGECFLEVSVYHILDANMREFL